MSSHAATLIPGDGIGPEVTAAARRCIEATGVDVSWDVRLAGAASWERDGQPLPAATLESVREHGVGLKGPLGAAVGGNYRSANVGLRSELGLWAGVRRCESLAGAGGVEGTDLIIVRMNGEDLYAGIEFPAESSAAAEIRAIVRREDGAELADDVGIALKVISAASAERIAKCGFELASEEGRSKLTVVHKASVMPGTDGVLLEAARRVGRDFDAVEFEDRLVDTVCHDLVARPGSCDVLLCPMQYGDILSDLGAALVGGLGMVAGANLGDDCALFEAAHGTAPRHAGRNRVNPTAMILCGALLLEHLGEADAAVRLRAAVAAVVSEGCSLTYDICGDGDQPVGTSEMADAIVAELA